MIRDDPAETETQAADDERDPSDQPVVVGIGASAGGLEALRAFFEGIPADSGAAFVVVVHLSPQHESHFAELLQPHVKMPVRQVTETLVLEADHVYVIPPGSDLSAVDTHLRLSEMPERRIERAPVDHFFRTLAQTHDGDSIGVVLTGSGSDGSLGVREIKANGGIVIAQEPDEAQHDGMPRSAIATGAVDLVLPLAEIPEAVLRAVRNARRVPNPKDDEAVEREQQQLLHKVFAQVRARTARDFSGYKPSTILRRIGRRMQLHDLVELPAYLKLLRERPDEARELSDDLLINVTSFFRDEPVFSKLRTEVVPALFEGKTAEDHIRVWSVGCATGEEAYSLAILLLEEARHRDFVPRVQVFASDLHERSLRTAREGFFPRDVEADVEAAFLDRYFDRAPGGFRVRREVREMVIFAPHDLLGDPPFSRLDLVVCRNLLIYLLREVQRDVVELFHYALRPEGYLVLGSSETVDASDLFRLENKQLCIYRKRDVPVPEPRLPVFPVMRARLLDEPQPFNRAVPPIAGGALHERVVERYLPPSLLLDGNDRVVHLSESAGRYLAHPGGELTASVLRLVHERLRLELRALLQEVRRTARRARSQAVTVDLAGEPRTVVLDVRPSLEPGRDHHVLVIFDERNAAPGEQAEEDSVELEATQQRLQVTIEEYETSKEEMKSANEELQSANEELRSTLEELETSKEELQSMNEELQAVNQENRNKVTELSQLSSDLQNLLAATDIATLFLDREFRIQRFTPRVSDLFNVRFIDRSRPISDLTHRLGYDRLLEDAAQVLDRLVPIEREVRDESGAWYLTRLRPYRSGEDRIEGVVITFVDITERRNQEEALRMSEARVARDLAAMTRLHGLLSDLLISPDLRGALAQVLDGTLEMMGADKGNIQLYDAESGTLEILVQRGFGRESLEELHAVRGGDTFAGATALETRRRVMVEDVETELAYEELRPVAAAAGFRAVQSTPLLSRDGELLGVLSTYFEKPHRPSEHDLRLLDLYARQATDFIEHVRHQEGLQEADRRKDEFLALLGHELRNPLAAIHTALEVSRAGDDDSRWAGCRDIIQRQAENLRRLVDDLLQISRVTRGHIELRTEPVELSSVLERAVQQAHKMIEEGRHRLSHDLPGDGPWVEGDPTRLDQVFSNLLNNAARYTPPGGEIHVTLCRDGEHAVVSVRDTGVGIAPEHLEGIFGMFYQVTPVHDRSQGGLGIGLALVRSLVDLHGGTITARSDGPGEGSEFVIRLPTVQAPSRQAPSESPRAASDAVPRRVLAVDDDPDVASTLALLLKEWGHEVRTASDGQQALEVARSFHPEVALLDIGLPGMSGYEVARRIRAEDWGRGVLLIAQTGWGRSQDKEEARTAGFDHHLTKPLRLPELKGLLER